MVLQQIELVNIKQFANRKFLFQTGWNEVMLGNLGGKSTLIEALQSVLGMDPTPVTFFKQHTEESSVKLDFLLAGNIFSVQKKWERLHVTSWSAESQNTQYNLLQPEERLQWMKLFLNVNFKAGSCSEFPDELVELQYHFLVHCIYQPAASLFEQFMQQRFTDALFALIPYAAAAAKLSRLESLASEDLHGLKLHEQKLTEDRNAVEQRRRDADKLEQDIHSLEARIQQLEENQEQLGGEQAQTEHIHEYIAERKNEIEKIEAELRTQKTKLNDNSQGKYSEKEIHELNSKRAVYEDLVRRITDLEQRIIERSHLEKNLAGIQNEIQKLVTKQESVSVHAAGEHDGAGSDQIALYESEAQRIRDLLAVKSNLDEEVKQLQTEKQAYQVANDRYLMLTRSHQLLTQSDSAKIQSLMEQLEEQKARSLKDLDTLEASVHEERYRARKNVLQQTYHQIAEQKKKLEELTRRQTLLSKTHDGLGTDLNGEGDVKENIRKQITLKRYVAFVGDAVLHLKNTTAVRIRTEFIESLNGHAASTPWPNEFIRLISILNDPDKDSRSCALTRFSDTERLRFGVWLHLSMIRFFTSLDCAILDEHLAWMFDHEDLNRIYSTVDKMSLEQIIFFQRIPFS
jgi:hypothetical protein